MIWALLLFFLALVVVSAYLDKSSEGYFGTILFFSLAFFVYNMAIPLEMYLTNNGWARDDYGKTFIDVSMQTQIIMSSVLGYIGFFIGYLFVKPFIRTNNNNSLFTLIHSNHLKIPKSLTILVLISIFMAFFLAFPYFSEIGDYATWTKLRYKLSNLAFALELVGVSVAMIGFALIHRFKLGIFLSFLVILPNILYGIYSNDKDPILIALVAYSSIALRYKITKSLLGFILMWLVAISVGIAGVMAFSQHRGGQAVSFTNITVERGVFRRADPAGPLLSLVDTMSTLEEGNLTLQYGSTYAQGLTLWIPQQVWPNRPLDLSQSYAQQKISNWTEGVGLGFSLLSESFINFGWIGPLIQYFLFGIFWQLFWFGFLKNIFSDALLFYSVYIPVGFTILIKMHRAPFSGVVTSLMHIVIPLFVVYILLKFLKDISHIQSKG